MNMLSFADFLNNAFEGYDYFILSKLHDLAVVTKGGITPLFNFISLLAEKGILFLLIAIILIAFKKTRKIGICIFGAVCCGALITNICLKDLIARPRPFMNIVSDFNAWWQYIGSPIEDEFSFPSGHATAAMAFATAIFLTTDKKKSWPIFLFVIIMGISRNYLMVHFPSDILGGILVGAFAAFISLLITELIFKLLNKYNNKFTNFVLNFDLFSNSKIDKSTEIE